jgi:hypothetical protein
LPARIHSTPPAGKTPLRPVVSAKWIDPSRMTVTVAMLECGCQRYSIGVRGSPSAKAARVEENEGFDDVPEVGGAHQAGDGAVGDSAGGPRDGTDGKLDRLGRHDSLR